MEDLLLDFYSVLPGVSEDLIQGLYDLEASLLSIISLVYFVIAGVLSGFFYFNPFEFKRSFWKKDHWYMILATSSLISFLFTLGTCFQNEDSLNNSGISEFILFSLIIAVFNALLFFGFSLWFKKEGNPVARYTPF